MFQKFFKIIVLTVTVSGLISCAMMSQDTKRPHVDVTWLGGPTMLIAFNGVEILTDPMFGEGHHAYTMGDPNEMFDLSKGPTVKAHARLTPFPGIDASSVDLVILTHTHEDHFDQKAQAELSPAMPMILPVADVDKVKAMGFENLDGLDWGETRTIDAGPGTVTITAINAHHSENKDIDKILGRGNGYWIEFSQGEWKRTIYWTGDTFGTADVIKEVKRHGKPYVMVPHLGRVGTTGPLGQISMGVKEVADFALAVSPRKVLPIHHSTYALYLEPIDELSTLSQGKPYGLDLISVGTTVTYD